MRRESVLLVLVLLGGYALYGGLILGALAATQALAGPGDHPQDPMLAGVNQSPDSVDAFAFDRVDAGLDYQYEVSAEGNMQMVTNAGVYTADVDGDGWQDLLAIGGAEPVLYRNDGGQFEPSGALPPIEGEARSATFLDYDTDGDPDLVIFADGKAPQLLENVNGTYEHRAGFSKPLPLAWGGTTADYNRDGCPDLLVYQYGNWSQRLPRGFANYSVPAGTDNGNPNYLYRGTCSGFERVENAGLNGSRWSLAASFVDLTDDGRPDIHLANDINHDVVYINRGDGQFEQVILPERTNRNGMSSEIADVTGDGRLDVFVTNIFYPRWAIRKINAGLVLKARGNNLVANHGNGTFVMRGDQYGVNVGGWGWAAVLADLDNDGDEDLVHATRHLTFERRDATLTDEEQRQLREHEFYSHPAVWARAGHAFASLSAVQSGFETMNGRGLARLDYDRDGTLDLVFATTGEFQLYENQLNGGTALQVRVMGTNGAATALGAKVMVTANGVTDQRRIHARTDYLSQDSRVAHFGLENASSVDLRVVWPDGTERVFAGIPTDQRIVVGPDGIVASLRFGDGN